MSILDEIGKLCGRGELIRFEVTGDPRFHRVPSSALRKLFISRRIDDFLKSDRALVEETRADFNEFVMGELITVALHLDHTFCFMARLEPPLDEIWEIRIYDTEPQLRFYGRFAQRDTFVALLGPTEKSRLRRKRIDHNRIKKTCEAEWRQLFQSPALSRGEDIYGYFSSNVDLA